MQEEGRLPVRGTSLNLSALSCQGTIMMPIQKTESQKRKIAKDNVQRSRLIQAARGGDEEAIENLTLEDMDTYTSISKKIQKADIFSLVGHLFYAVWRGMRPVFGAGRDYRHEDSEKQHDRRKRLHSDDLL